MPMERWKGEIKMLAKLSENIYRLFNPNAFVPPGEPEDDRTFLQRLLGFDNEPIVIRYEPESEATPSPTPTPKNNDRGFLQRLFNVDNEPIVIRYEPESGATPAPTLRPTPTPMPTQMPRQQTQPIQNVPRATPGSISPARESTYSAVFPGFQSNFAQEDYINDLILAEANRVGVHPSLLAALFTQESGRFRPDVIYGPEGFGPKGYADYGLAQINEYWRPNVTREQAFDPYFAVRYGADVLKSGIDHFDGDINRGVASYNVGKGGANVQGDNRSGLGDKGQLYLDNVSRNLSDDLISELGLLPSEGFR